MNKKDLIQNLMKKTGHTQAEVRTIVDGVFDEISDALERGEEVKVVGFGTFFTRVRSERNGVSPKDRSKKIVIPQKTVPGVRFGRVLKLRVNK